MDTMTVKIEIMEEEINKARLLLREEGLDPDGLRDSIVSSIIRPPKR